MTVKDVAKLEGVSDRTVHKWIRDGILPAARHKPARRNDCIRISRDDYDQFIQKRKENAA